MMRIILFVMGFTIIVIILGVILSTDNISLEVEQTSLENRLAAINLPALKTEGTALHTHQHMDIFQDGKKITVPAGIGVDKTEGIISPLHTHDETGVIHVESDDVRDYTLGQFLKIWGVIINKTDKIKVYVNGKKINGDYQKIVLEPYQEIVIDFGKDLPKSIPSKYSFPADY